MSWTTPPTSDFDSDDEFHWPSWKFGLHMEAIFDDLYQRFNTTHLFIQDPRAFHRDVTEVAYGTSTKVEFYAGLQKKRDERISELVKIIGFINAFNFTGHFDHEMTQEQRFGYIQLIRDGSLDRLIEFFTLFLGPNKHGKSPDIDRLLSHRSLKEKYGRSIATEPVVARGQKSSHELITKSRYSEGSETSLGSGEQVKGFMTRGKKRARPADLVEEVEANHRNKRRRGKIGETHQDSPVARIATRVGVHKNAATQTDEARPDTAVPTDGHNRGGKARARNSHYRAPPRQRKPEWSLAVPVEKLEVTGTHNLSDRDIRAKRRASRNDKE